MNLEYERVTTGSSQPIQRPGGMSLPANSECALGFWTSLREDQNHTLRVDPASGVPAPGVAHSVRWLEGWFMSGLGIGPSASSQILDGCTLSIRGR